MKRLHRRALACLVAGLLVFAVAGCDAGQPSGLTVNGQDVSLSQLLKEFKALAAVNPAVKAAKGQYSTSTAAAYLTSRVQGMVIHDEMAKRGVTPTKADRTTARQELIASLASASTSPGSTNAPDQNAASASFKKLPKWFRSQLIETAADQLALQRALAPKGPSLEEQARKIYDANPSQYAQYCLSAIVTSDQASANAAKTQIQGGADFATVAKAVSIDPSKANGGKIGCVPKTGLQPDLAKGLASAKVGDVVGPITLGAAVTGSASEYVVLKVTSEKVQSFDEVKSQIEGSLTQPGAKQLNDLLTKKMKSAQVSVNPRLGTWETGGSSGPHVQAPKGAESTGSSTGPPTSVAP